MGKKQGWENRRQIRRIVRKTLLRFDKDLLRFDKDLLRFDKDLLRFDKDLLRFDKEEEILSWIAGADDKNLKISCPKGIGAYLSGGDMATRETFM